MRIALLQFYKNPTPVYQELSAVFRTRGHTVWLGSLGEPGSIIWHDGVKVVAEQRGPVEVPQSVKWLRPIAMMYRRIAYLFFLLRVKRFLRSSKLDVVQVNRPLFAFILPLFMPSSMRFFLDVRQIGEWDSDTLMGRFKNWRAVKRSSFNARWFYDRALFASVSAAKRVLGEKFERHGSITPIGVHDRFLSFPRASTVAVPTGSVVKFVFVGMVTRLRKLEILFDACDCLAKKTRDFHITIIGPDSSNGFYHRLLDERKLSEVMSILPPVSYSEVPKVITSHDVALAYVADVRDWKYQPTLKVLEYRALGMPIIATNNQPNTEVVRHEVNGLLVENDPRVFAEAMNRFVENRRFIESTYRNAQEMRSGLTWSDVARLHMEGVYLRYPVPTQ